jgi:hypothetical protein
MSFADGCLVRSAHKAERFSRLQVYVGRMGERLELWGYLFQFVELREKLFVGQFAGGKTPLGFVMCVDEVFHRAIMVCLLTALFGW